MKNKLNTVNVAQGINFNHFQDEKFSTNTISLNFVVPLDEKTNALYALLPRVLKRGYRECSDFNAFHKQLEELYNASAEGYVGKYGDKQVVSLRIGTIDSSLALEKTDLNMQITNIVMDMLLDPILVDGKFEEKAVEMEKSALIQQIESILNDKRSYAVNKATRLICKGEPAGTSNLGEVEDVEKITAESLYQAYLTLLATAHIEVVCAGCSDFEREKAEIQKRLLTIKRKDVVGLESQPHIATNKLETTEQKMAIVQGKMVLGFGLNQPADKSATKVMTTILGGTPHSKLFKNVREKLSLCYYCAARYDSIKQVVLVDSGVEFDNITKAYDEVLNQIEEIKNGNISDQEMLQTKLSLANNLRGVNDSVHGIAGWYLTKILTDDVKTPQEEMDEINQITKEQVVEVAKQLSFEQNYVLKGLE